MKQLFLPGFYKVPMEGDRVVTKDYDSTIMMVRPIRYMTKDGWKTQDNQFEVLLNVVEYSDTRTNCFGAIIVFLQPHHWNSEKEIWEYPWDIADSK